jgi:hypothetical protein
MNPHFDRIHRKPIPQGTGKDFPPDNMRRKMRLFFAVSSNFRSPADPLFAAFVALPVDICLFLTMALLSPCRSTKTRSH